MTPCLFCSSRSVRPRKGSGRMQPFRVFPALPVPDECAIPTCGQCGARFLDDRTIATLAPHLEWAYRGELQRRAIQSLRRIPRRVITQRRLELLLGLSLGYLSRIVCRSSVPSAPLVLLLAIVADGLPNSLQTVEEIWRE